MQAPVAVPAPKERYTAAPSDTAYQWRLAAVRAPTSPGCTASPRSATSQAYISQPLPPQSALHAQQPSQATAHKEWEGDALDPFAAALHVGAQHTMRFLVAYVSQSQSVFCEQQRHSHQQPWNGKVMLFSFCCMPSFMQHLSCKRSCDLADKDPVLCQADDQSHGPPRW